MKKKLSYVKVLSDDSSFQLVRTNPKLTGNLKISINESGDLWLNSIPVNPELAKDEYSRFPIDVNKSLASNIYRFFKNGETPEEIVFSLSDKIDLTKTSKDYKDQYNFSSYFSGIKYLVSNKYSERLSYFAPIYLKKTVPNYFIVLKIKDPLNDPININKEKFENNQTKTEYLIDLFKKASIIKTFDLRENSKAGKFIRDYLNNQNFPTSPLTVSFDDDQYTTWNGISIKSGTFGSSGELLYNEFIQSTPLKFFEENITLGFERNGLIFPNILNLEFIFDDTTSENYEINRYLGLYVNSIDLSELDIDLERLYAERETIANSPALPILYKESDDTKIIQSNPDGVILPYRGLDFNLLEFSNNFNDSTNLIFNYVTDKNDLFYLPKIKDAYNITFSDPKLITLENFSPGEIVTVTSNVPHGFRENDLIIIESDNSSYSGQFFIFNVSETQFEYKLSQIPSQSTAGGFAKKEIGFGKITLSDTKLDIGKFFGPSKIDFLQDSGTISEALGFPGIALKILNEFSHLDSIKLYHPGGSQRDQTGRYDELIATSNYELVPNAGDFYAYLDYDGVSGQDRFYFNSSGLVTEVAKAIAASLNSIRNRSFSAFQFNDYVFIKANVPTENDLNYGICFNTFGWNSQIQISKYSDSNLINKLIYFEGGSNYSGNRLIVDAKHREKLEVDIQNLLVKTQQDWSKIKKISGYFDLINEKNSITDSDKINAIQQYENKIVVVLEDKERPSVNYGEFLIKKKFRPKFGVFSLFPIKDLDFDFYSSDYSRFPNIDFHQNYFIPEGETLLLPGVEYQVTGGSILVGTTEYSNGDIFSVLQKSHFIIISGTPIVSYYSTSNFTYPIQDENGELINFPGFSILKDPQKVVPQDSTLEYSLKTKYFNGLTSSEYDFYKENESLDFALKSKITPYITKWGIKNGTDSRNNPYRLNTEIVFGRNNFSPDHTDRTQNPDRFTHEWFYIESKFNYTESRESIQKNLFYFDSPIDIDALISDPEYFINYFTYTPTIEDDLVGPLEVAPTQLRYSTIFANSAGKYEAFFKGFKASFKDVTDSLIIGEDGKPIERETTTRFENYKFSCLLKPVKEDLTSRTQAPIKYRIIEHKDFKFILVLIEISLGYLDQISNVWKSDILNEIGITNDINDPTKLFYVDPTFDPSGSLPFETIYGDYRIDFSSSSEGDISNLSHALLYSLKNKKFNIKLNNFSNVKLSSGLSIARSGQGGIEFTSPESGTIAQLKRRSIANYPSLLSDEIVIPDSTSLIFTKNLFTGQTLFIDSLSGITPNSTNPINRAFGGFTTFELEAGTDLYLTTPISTSPYTGAYSQLPLAASLEKLVRDNFIFYVLGGGAGYFEKLFERISFASFKKLINELDPAIEYESYSLNSSGEIEKSPDPKFYLEILDPAELVKINQVITQIDEDRPTQFSFIDEIGYNYEVAEITGNSLELFRYKGEYEPVYTPLLQCWSDYKFTKNQISDLTLANVRLNTNIESLLTLSNFNHIKVSPKKILELESDESYLPRYPKIGESTIGQSNLFLLNSNWDWGFHLNYLEKDQFIPAAGSLRIEEDFSFLAKIMIVPDTITLTDFKLTELDSEQDIEKINFADFEIVIQEKENSVNGFINLNTVLIRYFIESGATQKFNEYLVNTSEYIGNFSDIEQYVSSYIRQNILALYTIQGTSFFSRRNPEVISSIESSNPNGIEFNFLEESDRIRLGYTQFNGVEINNYDRFILRFKIARPVSSGISIAPVIKIKFI